jgi:hypothetical protein
MFDDGPHSLSSMQEMLQPYLPLLKPDGILVIEDIQSPCWIQDLRVVTPAADHPFINIQLATDQTTRRQYLAHH